MTRSTLSPWSNIASPIGQSTFSPSSGDAVPMAWSLWSSFPSQYGSQVGNYWTGLSNHIPPFSRQPQSTRQTTYSSQLLPCPNTRDAYSLQPDLTGFWRGSGGESVEVKRNYACIWGGEKPCNCIFFLIGQRMIADSPDTGAVRKYWFQRGGRNEFTLIDASWNLMTYQFTR
ncbi:MAG: hypothetical protein PVF93_10670 [Chromatiaceae bacterium]|jgi:hypothetical protein